MTDAVVFDLGGVLIDWDPRHLYRRLFDDEDAMEQFLSQVCTPAWNHEQDRGRPIADAVRLLQSEHPDRAELISAYYARWPEMLGGPIEGTVTALRELHASGVPLYALTNWSAETFPVAVRRYEFLQLFRGILVSGEERLAKPEPEFFELLASRFGLDPSRSLYIDDSSGHVDAARVLGFDALVFTGPPSLRIELEKRRLLQPV